jgi:hypothetical protein
MANKDDKKQMWLHRETLDRLNEAWPTTGPLAAITADTNRVQAACELAIRQLTQTQEDGKEVAG